MSDPEQTSSRARENIHDQFEPALVRWLRVNPKYRSISMLSVGAAILLASAVLVYLCWFRWLLLVWRWGFDPPNWKGVFSLVAAFYLIVGPFLPFYFGRYWFGGILSLYSEEREQQQRASLSELEYSKALTEESLAVHDVTGLIPLVRYSRLQLESYYTLSKGQNQRSFRYAILAMWIGFLVITGGIILYILPGRTASTPAPNINLLTIGSGTVIELISALFLWIYRSSIEQLTYFYNRQMYLHSVLVANRIADSMKDSDGTKRLLVERILDPQANPQPKLPALSTFRGRSTSEAPVPTATTS